MIANRARAELHDCMGTILMTLYSDSGSSICCLLTTIAAQKLLAALDEAIESGKVLRAAPEIVAAAD